MESIYRTKDLNESAFLYASGQKLIKLEDDKGRFYFVFEDGPTCQRLIAAYWQKETSISPKEFADALRSLKDRIFSAQRV